VTRGRDEGKVNRNTEWYLRIAPLTETVQWPLMDNTPPSGPSTDDPNINGTPNPSGDGACFVKMWDALSGTVLLEGIIYG